MTRARPPRLALGVALAAVGGLAPAPAVRAAAPVDPASATTTPRAVAGRLPARLRSYLARQAAYAGRYSGAYALDLDTRQVLVAQRAAVARVPASVQKLYTTSAALTGLGASAQLRTSVLGVGRPEPDGTWAGDLYLRGGGDPTFGSQAFARRAYGSPASAEELARQLAQGAGLRRVTGRVVGDESAWDGLRGGPSSGFAVSAYVGPLSALAFDRGLADARGSAFQRQPAAFAAARLDRALRAEGVAVERKPAVGAAPAGAPELAGVSSPPVAELIRLTNQPSDNFLAEMLLKGLGQRFTGTGSTLAGARVVARRAAGTGVRTRVADGSGLSRANRTSPAAVVRLLDVMHRRPDAAAFAASLPLAGRSGTLATRMRRTSAQDRCRAKTGTLVGVSALAGYCRTVGGHTVAFALLMNGVSVAGGRRLQDRFASALAGSATR